QKAAFFLEKAYRDVFESYRLIGARRAQRQAYAEQVEARTKEFIIGEKTIDFLLEAQRQWANALSTEYQAIVAYNNALATFQFAKGTIMQYDTVSIAEGILPQCVAGRATEHERERSTALVLRQLDNPVPHAPPAPVPDELKAMASLPQLSPAEAPRLPALMRGSPKLPANLDELPMPTPTVKAGQPQQLPQALKVASPTMSQMPRSEMPAALPLPKAPQLQQTSHTYKYSAPAASQPSALPTPATVATPAPAVSGNLPLPLPAAATVNKTSGPAWPN
ncbi:MAG TPA: hypothetical protein VEL76_20270, partial [Gemmataceae bacterium]|nr:hypothetical protein [Gemmataceae bacterium]